MIALLKGTIAENRGSSVVVMTAGGIGYELQMNPSSAQQWTVGTDVHIITYLAVREDALELYGFAAVEEKELFTKLLLVNGIGPKTALHILSLGSVSEITSAINRGDVAYLTSISGVGKKLAERIVVELKNKIFIAELSEKNQEGGLLMDVVEGLLSLGYSTAEARAAVKKLDTTNKTSEQLLKEALQAIQR